MQKIIEINKDENKVIKHKKSWMETSTKLLIEQTFSVHKSIKKYFKNHKTFYMFYTDLPTDRVNFRVIALLLNMEKYILIKYY